MEKCL